MPPMQLMGMPTPEDVEEIWQKVHRQMEEVVEMLAEIGEEQEDNR